MTNLGHVYIIKSKDREEIINLEKKKVKMNSALLVNISWFVFTISHSNYNFNNIFLLHKSISLYILFIILYPVNGNKSGLIASSFFIVLDLFSNSGGIHATACLVLAYLRPSLLNLYLIELWIIKTIKLNDVITLQRFTFILCLYWFTILRCFFYIPADLHIIRHLNNHCAG
jgi:hypothetical protein